MKMAICSKILAMITMPVRKGCTQMYAALLSYNFRKGCTKYTLHAAQMYAARLSYKYVQLKITKT